MIEVMIPFPFVFDVEDEFREGNRRELTKGRSHKNKYILVGEYIVFLVSQHLVGSLFNLSNISYLSRSSKKGITKHSLMASKKPPKMASMGGQLWT